MNTYKLIDSVDILIERSSDHLFKQEKPFGVFDCFLHFLSYFISQFDILTKNGDTYIQNYINTDYLTDSIDVSFESLLLHKLNKEKVFSVIFIFLQIPGQNSIFF